MREKTSLLFLLHLRLVSSFTAVGIPYWGNPSAGLATDNGLVWSNMTDHVWGVKGDTRAYVVRNWKVNKQSWYGQTWENIHLLGRTLSYTVDLSNVDCGCAATVYLVAINQPSASSNYCDAAQGCFELDIMEGNKMAFHTSLHTDKGSTYDGKCNKNGCVANMGRFPFKKDGQRTKDLYGPGAKIDSTKPFRVITTMDMDGRFNVTLKQGHNFVHHATAATMSNQGNPSDVNNPATYPAPIGIPEKSLNKTRHFMERGVTLVVSIWEGGYTHDTDTHWLDGAACNFKHYCNLAASTLSIRDLRVYATPGGEVWKKEKAEKEHKAAAEKADKQGTQALGGCKDTDNGQKDIGGNTCKGYKKPFCGHLDGGGFKANDMCCLCGGGSTKAAAPSLATSPAPSPAPTAHEVTTPPPAEHTSGGNAASVPSSSNSGAGELYHSPNLISKPVVEDRVRGHKLEANWLQRPANLATFALPLFMVIVVGAAVIAHKGYYRRSEVAPSHALLPTELKDLELKSLPVHPDEEAACCGGTRFSFFSFLHPATPRLRETVR